MHYKLCIKSFVITIICCLMPLSAFAQDMLVYYVVGNVTYTSNGTSTPLTMNTRIAPTTVINVPADSRVELIDVKNAKRIILLASGKGAVSTLSKNKGNTVTSVSQQYVQYVLQQMDNDQLTALKQHSRDSEQMANLLKSIEDSESDDNGFADMFNEFREDIHKEFEEFRRKNNEEYAEFVRQIWKQFKAAPVMPKPQDDFIKPVVYEGPEGEPQQTDMWRFLAKIERVAKKIFKPNKDEVEKMQGKKRPKPATPKKVEETKEQPIQEVKIPKSQTQFASMPFTFFGTEMSVRIDESRRLYLGKVTPDNVADLILNQLSTKYYDNTIVDCLALREKYNLCDWAYLLLLQTISDTFCGKDTKESALLTGYIYCQSGYKIRFATDATRDNLYLLVGSRHFIYGKSPWMLDGDFYYPVLETTPTSLLICEAAYPQEQKLSLFIPTTPHFTEEWNEEREVASQRYPEVKIHVKVNQNLMNFYETYPSSRIGDDFTTRWVMYANTPMQEDIKNQIYPELSKALQGKSPVEKVERILNLIQTGLEYGYDDVVWGGDRAFFSEETLNYPLCDCEDRSILFTRLVRDLVGLKCALIYYPGHLAAAVHFDEEVGGVRYMLDNVPYVVCDATYIGASVGMQMPDCDDATLIAIE
ncbi:MAG: hypothetical protein IKH43_07640 [Bacteroidaceae bacterium]|nr:hypothetical protein [Bacteroidaceae bacterium]